VYGQIASRVFAQKEWLPSNLGSVSSSSSVLPREHLNFTVLQKTPNGNRTIAKTAPEGAKMNEVEREKVLSQHVGYICVVIYDKKLKVASESMASNLREHFGYSS